MQQGKRKGGRLAGTCLGDAEEVLACNDAGNGLSLNGSRGIIAFVGQRL